MPQRDPQNTQDNSSPDSSSVITCFDELTKGLATGAVSRRKALRWMGSALVGAALASVPGVAWAACPEGQTRCGDRCVNLKTNERHCGSCSNRCRSTHTCCKGRCVNLQKNERHCGSCFNRCAEGQECVGGVCQGGCGCGTTLCGGLCFANCPSGLTLNASTCQCEGECPTGQVFCNYGGQGLCVSNTCPPNQTYNPDSCGCECAEGDETCYPDCGGHPCPVGCYCSVRVDNGSKFCYSGGRIVDSCAECIAPEEACVYDGSPPVGLACVNYCWGWESRPGPINC